MTEYIDLTRLIQDGLKAYPGDRNTILKKSKFLEKDSYNNYLLETGMHTGTHIDSPMHLTDSPDFLYEYPLDCFIGHGVIIDAEELKEDKNGKKFHTKIKDRDIVLLYTGKSKLFGSDEYFEYAPDISEAFLNLLIEKNIKMLGMDCSSPDKFPFPVHKKLFSNKTLMIENLTNLDPLLNVEEFEIIALPLKIEADSSIARVIAKIEH